MVKENGHTDSAVLAETSHRCGLSCLGPLTLHSHAVGDKVRLSNGGCVAERTEDTFKNGVVFSSRPLKAHERIRVRVERESFRWNGGLRVGFTTVPPSGHSLPLPVIAIPDLTRRPGHWAAPLEDSDCQVGSVVEFWFTKGGHVYYTSNNVKQQKLLSGLDLSKPLWAMMDVYGQTTSIVVLGSEKKELFSTRRSCPVPALLTYSRVDRRRSSDGSSFDTESLSGDGSVPDCVVCMGRQAQIALPCGHQCLCNRCYIKVSQHFGCCPLCRHQFRGQSEEVSL